MTKAQKLRLRELENKRKQEEKEKQRSVEMIRLCKVARDDHLFGSVLVSKESKNIPSVFKYKPLYENVRSQAPSYSFKVEHPKHQSRDTSTYCHKFMDSIVKQDMYLDKIAKQVQKN